MPQDPFKHRRPRSWQKFTITANVDMADHIAGYAATLGDGGVEQIDPPKDTPAAGATIVVYLDDASPETAKKEKALQDYLCQLPNTFPGLQVPQISIETIAEEDWGKKWKEGFKPFNLTARLVIKPTWENYTPKENETVIELDPGMAFGTGLHASTRLAMELIDNHFATTPTAFKKILDVGTGTGILGMAAVLFGAVSALAIDNDPDAVAAALDNFKQNNMSDKAQASTIDLADVSGEFDLVVANIIHDVLIELAPGLYKHIKPGGVLILSGILAGKQAANIHRTFTAFGLLPQKKQGDGEWQSISFLRPISG